jgi:error-prone DNA polymerase
MGLDRRQALWEARALSRAKPLPLFAATEISEKGDEPETSLPAMPLAEHVIADYRTIRMSLKAHPMTFLREDLAKRKVRPTSALNGVHNGQRVSVAGIVLVRQRPGTAKGVVFMTIEDETGVANIIVWPKVLERFRPIVMGARLVVIHGRVQSHDGVMHVVAMQMEDRTAMLDGLSGEKARTALARADEVQRPVPERSTGRRHPRDMQVLPKSRDFH